MELISKSLLSCSYLLHQGAPVILIALLCILSSFIMFVFAAWPHMFGPYVVISSIAASYILFLGFSCSLFLLPITALTWFILDVALFAVSSMYPVHVSFPSMRTHRYFAYFHYILLPPTAKSLVDLSCFVLPPISMACVFSVLILIFHFLVYSFIVSISCCTYSAALFAYYDVAAFAMSSAYMYVLVCFDPFGCRCYTCCTV